MYNNNQFFYCPYCMHQNVCPVPIPPPVPTPGGRWSQWEDLGGNITSAPAVSSRSSNRLEVFARGQSNQLITKTWNGSRLSDWQYISGTFTSDPTAVSWGPNRTDVLAKGTNNALLHIWRD